MNMDTHFSAVKVDVSCISKTHESKVLVISNESSTRDVLKMALHKCKNRKVSPEDIELIAEADQQMKEGGAVELLQFEEDDKPLFTYLRYPKGAVRFHIKPKNKDKFPNFKESSPIETKPKPSDVKPSLAGHQFTVDRLRKSLERLRRKSVSDPDSSPAPSSGRSENTTPGHTPNFTPFTQNPRSKSFSEYRGVAHINGSTISSNTMMKPREDCMIVYDNPLPVRPKPTMGTYVPKGEVNESRTRTKYYEQQLAKQGVIMNGVENSNGKLNFRNLEDSGIDMNTPPFLSKGNSNGNSNGSQFNSAFTVVGNRTLTSSCSPYSTVSADPYDGGVRRTNSFSLPGNDPNNQNGKENKDLTRTQSLQSLNGVKVKRRRSLPQVEITKETLEEKKNSLSQRLAKKIGKYRKEGNNAILPSTFSPQTLELFKELQQAKGDFDIDDCMSVSSLEVATILDGKPSHPTDEDVEEYLSMVEPAYGGKPKTQQNIEKPKTFSKDNGVSHIPKPKLEPKHFANNALSVDKIQKHFKQKQKIKHSHSMGDFERRPKPGDHHIKQSNNSTIQKSQSNHSDIQTHQSFHRNNRHSFSHKEQYDQMNPNHIPEIKNSRRTRDSKNQPNLSNNQNGVNAPKTNGYHNSGAYSSDTKSRDSNQPITDNQQNSKTQRRLSAEDITIDLSLAADDSPYKPLSLFTILKTHFLVMVYLEKGEYFKSYGIMVCKSALDNKDLTGYDDGAQSVITISKIIEGGPADLEGTLQPGDIVVEINGHHVLQSSDKAIRALLDARSSLELVVARLQEGVGFESPPISSV